MSKAPFINDSDFTLYVGDVREVLADLPDESIDCVVTSPPYWLAGAFATTGRVSGRAGILSATTATTRSTRSRA